tara:strand:+ start:400 stop:582 length:183 start_codon:yes stop_codon:yes gene_type:complete
LRINDRVPDGMEVLGTTDGWKSNTVASSISLWVLVVNSGGSVKRLMDISGIMEQESQSCG